MPRGSRFPIEFQTNGGEAHVVAGDITYEVPSDGPPRRVITFELLPDQGLLVQPGDTFEITMTVEVADGDTRVGSIRPDEGVNWMVDRVLRESEPAPRGIVARNWIQSMVQNPEEARAAAGMALQGDPQRLGEATVAGEVEPPFVHTFHARPPYDVPYHGVVSRVSSDTADIYRNGQVIDRWEDNTVEAFPIQPPEDPERGDRYYHTEDECVYYYDGEVWREDPAVVSAQGLLRHDNGLGPQGSHAIIFNPGQFVQVAVDEEEPAVPQLRRSEINPNEIQ